MKDWKDFIVQLAHDLQSPVTVIIGMADLLKEGIQGPLNTNQRNGLKLIDTQAKFLSQIAKEASMFAKISAPGFKASEPEHLEFALAVLTDHASAVSENFTVTKKEKNGQIKIEITDFGPPLDTEEIALIFTPFSPIRARGKVKVSTLGFAVSQKIIEMRGGSLKVDAGFKGGLKWLVRLDS